MDASKMNKTNKTQQCPACDEASLFMRWKAWRLIRLLCRTDQLQLPEHSLWTVPPLVEKLADGCQRMVCGAAPAAAVDADDFDMGSAEHYDEHQLHAGATP